MDEQFSTILSIAIIPQTIALISEKEKITEQEAINLFYSSKVYQALADERTKTWHFSPLTIYSMWKDEEETGEVIFPEEGLSYE